MKVHSLAYAVSAYSFATEGPGSVVDWKSVKMYLYEFSLP